MNKPSHTSFLSASKLSCERDHRVLFSGLDITMNSADLIELRGPNGCGKTTLLRCLAGLSLDYLGSIERPLKPVFIGHKGGLNPLLTPRENLRWYLSLLSGPAPEPEAIPAALATVGLSGYADMPCQYLSAGQQRRAILARLVLSDAPLWLLDEPLTALDGAGVELVRGLITRHASAGGGAIYATHQALDIQAATALVLA